MLKYVHLFVFVALFPFHAMAGSVTVSNAYIPEMPPNSTVMAAYMDVQNTSAHPVILHGVNSTGFERIEIHLSSEVNGVAKMQLQKQVNIPAKAKVEFKPGSYHLMLFNPRQSLQAGDKVKLSLLLDNKESISVDVEVVKGSTVVDDHAYHMHH